MSDCLSYVENGSMMRHLDKPWCPELDRLLQSNPVCLYQLLAGGAESYNIRVDYKRVMELPDIYRLNVRLRVQGDLLRQQSMQQMHRISMTRQTVRVLLIFNDSSRRALSSLWPARPRDCTAAAFVQGVFTPIAINLATEPRRAQLRKRTGR